MKKVRGWGLLTVVVAVALFAAACGDDSGSSSATTAAGGGSASTTAATADTGASTTAGAPVSGTLQGSGSTLPAGVPAGGDRASRRPTAGPTSRTAAAAPARAAPTWRQDGRLRRLGLAVQGRRQAGRARSSTSRSCSARSPSRTTSPASTSCSCRPTRSPRSSSARSRSGTTRRSPPTTRALQLPSTRRSSSPTAPTARARRRTSPSGLTLAAPDTWTLKSGSTVEWPADTQAGNGNAGVAQIVKATNGAIGYVDLSDAMAAGLTFASVKNKAGKFIEPTAEVGVGRRRRRRRHGRPDVQRAQRDGPGGLPDHRQTWIIVYAEADRRGEGRRSRRTSTTCSSDGQDAARRPRLRAAADVDPGEGRRPARQDHSRLTGPTRSSRRSTASHEAHDRHRHDRRRRRLLSLRGKRPGAAIASFAIVVLACWPVGAGHPRPDRLVDDQGGVAGLHATTGRASSSTAGGRRTRASSARSSFIYGTLRHVGRSPLIFAVPVSIGIALFITEVAPRGCASAGRLASSTCSPRSRRWCSACGASSCSPTPINDFYDERQQRARRRSRCSARSSRARRAVGRSSPPGSSSRS